MSHPGRPTSKPCRVRGVYRTVVDGQTVRVEVVVEPVGARHDNARTARSSGLIGRAGPGSNAARLTEISTVSPRSVTARQ